MSDLNAEELFATRYELKHLADLLIEGKSERWLPGFCVPQVDYEHMQRYEWAAQYTKGEDVLDLACGSGRGSRYLAEAGGAKSVTGGDVDPDAVRYATHRNRCETIRFQLIDALNIKLSELYDRVVCFETIEHVPRPAECISNLARCLRANGELLISTPISRLETDLAPDNPYHCQEWGLHTFVGMVQQHFEVIEQLVQYYLFPTPVKRSLIGRLYRKINGPPELAVAKAFRPIVAKTTILPWQPGLLDLSQAGVIWAGYQLLRCRVRASNSKGA